MSKLFDVHRTLNQWCADNGIASELILSDADTKAVLIPRDTSIGVLLEGIHTRENGIHAKTRMVDAGVLLVLSPTPVGENTITDLAYEADDRFSNFYKNLSEALEEPAKKEEDEVEMDEEQDFPPTNANKRAGSNNQFRASFTKPKDWDIDTAIDEAFDGIAVPDDATQPQDGIKRLQATLKEPTRSGMSLGQALKKAGVSMTAGGPGKHVVVFARGGQEVWRVDSMNLGDAKTLEETLSALWSLASGKAPNARIMEIEAEKARAAEARDAEKELTDIAQKHSADAELEAQQAEAGPAPQQVR